MIRVNPNPNPNLNLDNTAGVELGLTLTLIVTCFLFLQDDPKFFGLAPGKEVGLLGALLPHEHFTSYN